MNENIKNLRQEIAKLEKEQKNTKVQRKDVNFHGERTISPYQAVLLVPRQRHTLRLMYAAYGLMRGRKFKDIETFRWYYNEFDKALVKINKKI